MFGAHHNLHYCKSALPYKLAVSLAFWMLVTVTVMSGTAIATHAFPTPNLHPTTSSLRLSITASNRLYSFSYLLNTLLPYRPLSKRFGREHLSRVPLWYVSFTDKQ